MRVLRALTRASVLIVALLAVSSVVAEPTILLIAGEPSHGPGEHRFPEGCQLLAKALNESHLGVSAETSVGWPSQDVLSSVNSIVVYSDGLQQHVANGHLGELRNFLRQGKGLVVLHFALEPSRGEAAELFLDSLGGVFEAGWSVNPVWTLRAPSIARHEVTHGVEPFELEDEWYYHLRFREGITPILLAQPSTDTLGVDGPRSGNPAVRQALAEHAPQTLAWVFEKEGRRAFGFTGGHFHRNWNEPNFRKLVLNAIVWSTGVSVPVSGVESSIVPIPRYATIEEAIARNDLDDVKRHVAASPALLKDGNRPLSPLHQAILRNRTAIATWLIDAGIDPNAPDRSQRTPLHLAVERSNLELVKILLARKVHPNERDKMGWTPLHHAAAKNQIEIARALLMDGADPSVLSERGGTPLHEAAASGGAEMVQLLLDHGVDPNVVSSLGVTALDVAREFKNEAAISQLTAPKPNRK